MIVTLLIHRAQSERIECGQVINSVSRKLLGRGAFENSQSIKAKQVIVAHNMIRTHDVDIARVQLIPFCSRLGHLFCCFSASSC
jgi:hypothetical protein